MPRSKQARRTSPRHEPHRRAWRCPPMNAGPTRRRSGVIPVAGSSWHDAESNGWRSSREPIGREGERIAARGGDRLHRQAASAAAPSVASLTACVTIRARRSTVGVAGDVRRNRISGRLGNSGNPYDAASSARTDAGNP